MKKILAIVLMATFCVGLVGCGDSSADNSEQKESLKQNQVRMENLVIALDDSMDAVKEALGEPLEYSESKSCMYDGFDKTYTYADVVFITYPKDGGEYINSITVLSNKVETGCGVLVGDSTDAITSKYNEDEMVITKSCYMYETEDLGVAFYVENDVVTEIEIYTIEN